MGKYLTAVDFGSSKIAVAVGEKTQNGVRIVFYREKPATGIKNGEITNELNVIKVLNPLVEEAVRETGSDIEEVIVNISGKVLRSKEMTKPFIRPVDSQYINESEMERVERDFFKKDGIAEDETIYEAIPQSFNVDDVIGIPAMEVIGMTGHKVEATYRLFYGKSSILQRRKNVLSNCNLRLKSAILSPIASARAVLTEQEMENGVVMADIGKGITEIVIVKDNVVRNIGSIPFGGDSVTNDIKVVTDLSYKWAEEVKVRYGCCLEEYTPENKRLVLKGEDNITEGEVEFTLLSRVIEARMSEIFDAISYIIDNSGCSNKVPSGVVLTGGCCYLDNTLELAKAILGRKVRIAAPRSCISGDSVTTSMDTNSSTAVGLVLEGFERKLSCASSKKSEPAPQPAYSAPKQVQVKEEEPVMGNIFGEDDEEEQERWKKEQDRRRIEQEKMKKEQKEREKQLEKKRKAEEKEKEKEREKERQRQKNEGKSKGSSLFDGLFGKVFSDENNNA